ncbi:hypothetical protein PCASD_23910 [Puccinia coronata f. sp. avenae]|uniref:Uncharacterized protein n=1 Tax=Puccinia coronata f. sp. avenae TaxID=200324 RepID=A0A2N5SB61_9BASI|nr:hypothetical protein PCASD_23910 [Puccinia coronata f. sp. avenae]
MAQLFAQNLLSSGSRHIYSVEWLTIHDHSDSPIALPVTIDVALKLGESYY